MPRRVQPWHILGQKNFGLYWNSLLVSAIGDQIANVTIAWQIYEITHSPLQLGLTGLFRGLPILIFSLGGGLLADRASRRKVLIGTQSVGMMLTLILGFLTSTGLVRVWHIYAIAFCAGVANTFDQPARSALVPSLVAPEHLATAFGMSVTLRQSASLAGPFLGGAIIAAYGVSSAYWINAVSFIGVIVCLAFMKIREEPAKERRESPLQSLRDGVKFVWNDRDIMALLTLDTIVNLVGAFKSMMPIFAKDLLAVGAQGLGVLLGAPAVGALVGSGVVIFMGNPKRKGSLILLTTLLYCICLILFALSRSFALSLVAAFLLGAFDSVGETFRMTVTQLKTPDYLRGRVQSLILLFVMGGPLLGQAQLGATAALLDVTGALVLGGAIGIAASLVLARRIYFL